MEESAPREAFFIFASRSLTSLKSSVTSYLCFLEPRMRREKERGGEEEGEREAYT